jgi:hypothetical protein
MKNHKYSIFLPLDVLIGKLPHFPTENEFQSMISLLLEKSKKARTKSALGLSV